MRHKAKSCAALGVNASLGSWSLVSSVDSKVLTPLFQSRAYLWWSQLQKSGADNTPGYGHVEQINYLIHLRELNASDAQELNRAEAMYLELTPPLV